MVPPSRRIFFRPIYFVVLLAFLFSCQKSNSPSPKTTPHTTPPHGNDTSSQPTTSLDNNLTNGVLANISVAFKDNIFKGKITQQDGQASLFITDLPSKITVNNTVKLTSGFHFDEYKNFCREIKKDLYQQDDEGNVILNLSDQMNAKLETLTNLIGHMVLEQGRLKYPWEKELVQLFKRKALEIDRSLDDIQLMPLKLDYLTAVNKSFSLAPFYLSSAITKQVNLKALKQIVVSLIEGKEIDLPLGFLCDLINNEILIELHQGEPYGPGQVEFKFQVDY